MRPVRPSLADLAGHCGHAVTLAESIQIGSEWATMGTAKHTKLCGAVVSAQPPEDEELARGYHMIVSRWPDATWEKEVKCELRDPDTGARLIPEDTGHCDLVGTLPDGRLIIGELKFGSHPVPLPDDSMQPRLYGLALSLERGAPAFMPWKWQPRHDGFREGRWYTDGDDYWAILREQRRICEMSPEPVVGRHCDDCYRSQYCEAHLIPATALAIRDHDADLVPITKPGGLTAEKLAPAYRLKRALGVLVDAIDVQIKGVVRAAGGKVECEGSAYELVETHGHRYVDLGAAEEAGLLKALEAAGAVKRSRDSERIMVKAAR